MEIRSAEFIKSAHRAADLPNQNYPEYAFVGRSNVGKSSLINYLFNNKRLAKTSSTPGKTQLLNAFIINHQWFVVDLPGYGYAKVSKQQKKEWQVMIQNYIKTRPQLWCIFVLIDIRLDLQENDASFLTKLLQMGIPFCIIYTKADKLSTSVLKQKVQILSNSISQFAHPLPTFFISSSTKNIGRDEILHYIETLNNRFFNETDT